MSYRQYLKEVFSNGTLKDKLIDFLRTKFEDDESFDGEAEVAIYWFANGYHGGQRDELYSIMSKSLYRPGRLMKSVQDEGGIAEMMYDELVRNKEKFL